MPAKRLLLIEDDYDMCFLARKSLREALPEREVVDVPSAEIAVSRLQAESFALLITDIKLLGAMSGLDLAKRVQELPDPPPVIVLTSSDEMRGRALAAGAADFLSTSEIVELGLRASRLLGSPVP